jgi:hypothetical protein
MQKIVTKLKELSIPYPIIEIGGVKYYDLTDFIITKKENDMDEEMTEEEVIEKKVLFTGLQEEFNGVLELELETNCDLGIGLRRRAGIMSKLTEMQNYTYYIFLDDRDEAKEDLKEYWIGKLTKLIREIAKI